MKRFSDFVFGDMLLSYFLDDENRMSMTLIPAEMKDRTAAKEYQPEPLVQIHETISRTGTATGIRWRSHRRRTR